MGLAHDVWAMLALRCRKCDEEVSRGVSTCPECGYDPGGTARDVAAVVLVLSVPLAIALPPLGVLGIFSAILLFGWSILASPGE